MSLLIAMLISLFAGEHMYIYRAHFAMFGTFIFILTYMELILDETNSYEEENAIESPIVYLQ